MKEPLTELLSYQVLVQGNDLPIRSCSSRPKDHLRGGHFLPVHGLDCAVPDSRKGVDIGTLAEECFGKTWAMARQLLKSHAKSPTKKLLPLPLGASDSGRDPE